MQQKKCWRSEPAGTLLIFYETIKEVEKEENGG
jgi:hypothetical protein